MKEKLTKSDTKVIEKYSINCLQEYLDKRKIQEMKSLSGQRILGFNITFQEIVSGNKSKSVFPSINAFRAIKGKRISLNLGKVYSTKEAEKVIRDKMKIKIENNPDQREVLEKFMLTKV